MHAKVMLKGDYIAAVELGTKQPTLTIQSVKLVKLESIDKPGKERDRGVIGFKEIDRGWVMNRTNIECLMAMFGDETDAWLGKRVTIFATPVRVGTKTEPGIRIKGSPDIAQPIDAVIKLPRKKPITMTLVPTGKGASPAGAGGAAPDSNSLNDQPPPIDEEGT
jgi:hypothetical protein